MPQINGQPDATTTSKGKIQLAGDLSGTSSLPRVSAFLNESINQNTTLSTFGDSITAGSNATTTPNRYTNLIATNKNWSLTNNGVNGARLNDPYITDVAYAEVVTNTKNYTMLIGVNDSRANGTNLLYLDNFRGNLAAVIAWLGIPDTYKVKAGATTKTGTWVQQAGVYAGLDYNSSVNGSTMTTQVQGSTVYVGYTRTVNDIGTFTVSIDGVSRGTFSTGSASIPTRQGTGGLYSPYLLRFPGLTNGAHTVLITVTSASGANRIVYIDWIAGSGFPKEISGPNVWLGNCIRATDAYYSGGGSSHSDASVAIHNASISDVATTLAADGLNITLVDAMAALNRTTDIDTDGLHPTDAGMAKLAGAFLSQMSSLAKTRDKGGASKQNSPWYDVTFQNSWVNFGAGFNNVGYMKDANGFIRLRGLAKSGTVGSTTPVFTLPLGFVPPATNHAPVISNGANGIVEVTNDGRVCLVNGTNAYVSFDGYTFLAEQ